LQIQLLIAQSRELWTYREWAPGAVFFFSTQALFSSLVGRHSPNTSRHRNRQDPPTNTHSPLQARTAMTLIKTAMGGNNFARFCDDFVERFDVLLETQKELCMRLFFFNDELRRGQRPAVRPWRWAWAGEEPQTASEAPLRQLRALPVFAAGACRALGSLRLPLRRSTGPSPLRFLALGLVVLACPRLPRRSQHR
jgi:hypothetical protein